MIYIGKGTHDGESLAPKRMMEHWLNGNRENLYFHRILERHKALGLVPDISVLSWHTTQAEVFAAEKAEIKRVGRYRNGGTLCNLTDGGEGADGYEHSEESIAAIALAAAEKWKSQDHRQLIAEKWTPEKRNQQAESVKNRGPEYAEKIKAVMADPDRRKKSSDNAKVALQAPDVIARRKVTLKQTMATPEFRAAMSQRAKEALAKPEAKANQRAAAKKMWANPEYRAKMLEARRKPKSAESKAKQSAAMKEAIANMDPETKARLSALRSQIQRDRHAKNRAAKAIMALATTKP